MLLTQKNSSSSPGTDHNFGPTLIMPFPNLRIILNNSRTTEDTTLTGMQIRVLGVPQTGAKSRVETQIKLCIQLVTDDGDKAQRWSHLKLPEHMVVKEKLKRQALMTTLNGSKMANAETTVLPHNMLYLSSRVICASDPNRKVATCSGCIQRERKRSQRRKENKKKSPEIEIEKAPTAEEQKVLLFNCEEVVDFSSGDTILPTRITCYCRHHNERIGFCIFFEMHDHTGRQVASGMSPPIMITDDHKSNKPKTSRKRPRKETANTRFTSFDSRSSPGNHYQIQPRPTESLNDAFLLSPEILAVERPSLQRLIPNEGPTYGGIEVTLLGSGFRSGLTCMFGDVAALSTHFWSPNTLVCILPPATDASTVIVSFKEYPMVVDSQELTVFTYYNENDRALMELALQVVGLKMTGKVEDAREIAMRIVQGGDTSQSSRQPQNLEQQILQVLQVMSTFCDVHSADVSMTSAQGHTMLHYVSMLGWTQLTRVLLDLGCDTNVTDENGFTALHYATWHEHTEVVRLLLDSEADVDISNRWNKRPIQMTKNASIRQIMTNFSKEYSSSDDEESVCLSKVDWTADNPLIQYLDQVESASHSSEKIMDAEPLYPIDPPTDDEEYLPKEKNWMQRTLSHFQPNTHNDFLQNIMNTKPATDLKGITDHILSKPLSGLFSNNKEENSPPDQDLAWYMALAYAMGTRSLVSEDEKEEVKPEECTTTNKRRDKTLYSFWVPMLCVMITWLIFQFISSNPNVTDTIVSISGLRRQYHIIQ
ncbi:unnamed protein product [Rhizopus stolonifer]